MTLTRDTMKVGGRYNWKNQPERLIYMGRNWIGNGFWNQFALAQAPGVVWCEVLDSDLSSFEETPSASSSVMDEKGEREAFEAWAEPLELDLSMSLGSKQYTDLYTDIAWQAWTAGRSVSNWSSPAYRKAGTTLSALRKERIPNESR